MAAVIIGEGLGLYGSSLNTLGNRGPANDPVLGRHGNHVYVNAATGNLVVAQRDEFVASLGLDLAFTRTYNSLGVADGDNNDNWRLGFHRKLTNITAGTSITKVYGDGSEIVFNYDSALGYYVSTKGDGAHDTIRAQGSNWVWHDGISDVTETYDSTGKLLNIKDSDGNTKTFSYTGSLVTGISDSSGQTVTLTYGGNNLQSITTSSSGVVRTRVTYAYDVSNRLTRVIVDLSPEDATDAETFITNYAYDGASKRIATIDHTGGGVPDLAITYDASGRVLTLTDGSGNITRYTYGSTSTTVRDPLLRESTYHYDTQGRLTKVESPVLTSGGVRLATEYTYDVSGNVTQVKDGTGAIVAFQYDSRGNLTRQTDTMGNVVAYAYTADNLLATETVYLVKDPDYSGMGTISDGAEQAADPQTTYYIYDAEKHLRFVITPEGRVTENRYFADGTLSSTLRFAGNTYSIAPLQSAPAESALATWAAAANLIKLERVDYQYDFRGQLSRTTQYSATDSTGAGVASGASSIHFIYDQRGQLLKSVGPRGTAPVETAATAPSAIQHNLNNHETVYVYDGLGRLISQKDTLGAATSFVYDDVNNRVTTSFNKLSTSTNWLVKTDVYNNTGRLISSIEYDSAQPAADRTAYSLYDAAGQLRVSIDQASGATYYFYDGAGRQVAAIDPEGYLTEYSYDGNGRMLQKLSYATRVSQALLDQLAVDPAVLELLSTLGAGSTLTAGGSFNAVNSNGSTTQTAQFTNGSTTINTDLAISSAYQPSSVNNYAWTLSGGQLVQTTGISLAPGTALFNDATPTEVKATIYRSDGTLYDTVYTTVGTTTTQEIIVGRPPTQPSGYQATATNDTVTSATQNVSVTVDSSQQYTAFTQTSNVQNFGYTYSSSTRTIAGNGSGYSLVADSATHDDNTPTLVRAKVYTSGGTLVQTIDMVPGHTTTQSVTDSYTGNVTNYKIWNGATNWNGHVNLGSLGPGNYYAEISAYDDATSVNTTSSPGKDGDSVWSRTNTVNFTIGGQIPTHVSSRLSWSNSVTPADTASISFRYKLTSSGTWTSRTVGLTGTSRYVDIDPAANGTYHYEIIYRDTHGNALKTTNTTTPPTFAISNTTDSTSTAVFSYSTYSATATTGSSLPAYAMTAVEAQTIARIEARVYQYGTVTQVGATAVTYPAAHANYFTVNGQYYVNLRTGSVLPDGKYDVQIIKYYKNGTSSSVGQTLEVGTQSEPTNQNKFWTAANNWNGQVNLKTGTGGMPVDTYSVVIAVRDDAPNYGNLYGTQVGSASAPGADGDGTWTRTNTVNVLVGGRTTLQWSNAQQPQGTVVEFAYRAANAGNFTTVPVTLSGGQYSVKLDNPVSGSFEYRIRYLNASDAALTLLPALTLDQLRPQTDADDRQINNLYDNAGRLDRTTVLSEATIDNDYDGASRLVRTEQGGAITRYFYDKDGRLAGTLDAERFFSEHVYDSAGRLIQTVRYDFKVDPAVQTTATLAQIKSAVAGASTLKSCYYYDAQGRQVGRVNEQGFLQETVYDAQHAYREEKQYLTAATVAANDTLDTLRSRAGAADTTRFEFDKLARLSAKIAADGTITHYQYDTAGRLVRIIEAAGTADERITVNRYNTFGDVMGTATVAGAEVEDYAWVLDGNGNLVQTAAGGGISLAPGSALFNDTSPTEVKATIYKSDGTLYETVTTTVGVTETPLINIQTEAPDQPYGYQAFATSDTTGTATHTVSMTLDNVQQYTTLTNSANVNNYKWAYQSSTQSLVTASGGYSLATGLSYGDTSVTSVVAKVYRSDGTYVQTVGLTPGHTDTHWVHHDPYGSGDITYLKWNTATNWNGQVNIGSLNAGYYYAEITVADDAYVSNTTSAPGYDGDWMWTRTDRVDFRIAGVYADHIDSRLSWPASAVPADAATATFRYKAGSGSWSIPVTFSAATRYFDFDHAAGTYTYEIVFKDAYGNVLESTTANFTVNGPGVSNPTADFQYTTYLSSDETTSTLTVDSAQQYAKGFTTSSNVADYSWTYNQLTHEIQSNGGGYSLVAGSADRQDNYPTSVKADVFKSNGAFVQSVTLMPGHSEEQWFDPGYGQEPLEYEYWKRASNWDGQVNLGNLSPGDYYAVITTRDDAIATNTEAKPGNDGDPTWIRTNTVNFTIGGQVQDLVDTRLSWSESLTPTGTSSITFRYRPGSSGAWISKTVLSNGSSRYVNIDHAVNGTYEYEIIYLNSTGAVLKTTNTITPPTFTINGSNDSTPSVVFKAFAGVGTIGSSVTAFPMTASEAQTIARIEAKVFLAGTTTQVGTTAITYPQAHPDFAVNGQCRVNLSVGTVLADGRYDVQIIKFYDSGAVSAVDQHTLEVGMQLGPTNQNYFWNAADNWNGQVNLMLGAGMPADIYRIEISVKDTASTYGSSGGVRTGAATAPGADGDGTWTRITNVYATIGDASSASWNSAIDRYGVRYEIDGAGRRISELGPNGQKTLLYYDTSGRQVYSVNALGEVTAYTYNAFGEVESTKTYSNAISTSGLTGGAVTAMLSQRIDAIAATASETRYTYTKAGRLAAAKDAENYITTYDYNSRGERVGETRTIATGVTVNTQYDRDLLGRVTATHFDSLGSNLITTTVYDGLGRIDYTLDALGKKTDYTYASNGRMVTIADPANRTGKTEYDAYGRVLNVYDGLDQPTRYVYNTNERSLTVTTPDGVSIKTWKTRTGEVLKVEDGNGGVTEYDYALDGKLATVKDAKGVAIVQNSYDNSGRLLETRNGRGVLTRYTYDTANRIIERVLDPGTGTLNQRTTYQFDGHGRQILVTEGAGTEHATSTKYVYDRKGQVKEIIVDPTGLQFSTRFSYDGLGHTLTVERGPVTDPAKQVTQYSYDQLGRKTLEQRDPAGLNITTQYKYDANGRLTRLIDANGNSTWYNYDDSGKLARQIDSLGGVTRHHYDKNGRLAETVRFFNAISTAGFDDSAPGALDPSIHANDARTIYVYDSRNRQRYTLVAAGAGNWMIAEKLYDNNGNIIETRLYDQYLGDGSVSARTDAGSEGGTRVTEAEMASELAGLGYSAANLDARTQRTFYAYDVNNRLRFTVNALGEVSENVYDTVGNITKQTRFAVAPALNGVYTESNIDSKLDRGHSSNQSTQFVYDRANRLTRTIDALGKSEYFAYDALGNKTSYTNKNGAIWDYVYDKAGRLKAEITPAVDILYAGNTNAESRRLRTDFTYNALGNVTARTEGIVLLNADGSSVDSSAARTTSYDYDKLGRQILTIMPGWYDPATGRVEKDSAAGRFQITSRVKYDALGNAVRNEMRVANKGNSADFIYQYKTYDALGRVKHDIDALGNVTTNSYDALGNLEAIKRSANALAMPVPAPESWTAAAVEQSLGAASANDRTITMKYDRAGRKTETKQTSSGINYNPVTGITYQAAAATSYHYNALGQLTAEEVKVNDTERAITFHFYDRLNRETATVDAERYITAKIYDAFGNVKQTTEYAARVNVTGDMTNPVLPATIQPSYNDRRADFAYDKLNRLTSVTKSTVFVSGSGFGTSSSEALRNTYDNMGNITAQAVNGLTTVTVYDALGRVTHVTEPKRTMAAADALNPFTSTVTVSPVTDYVLDAFGKAVRIERSAAGAMNGETVTIQQKFDHVGNLLETTNGLNGLQAGVGRFEYDVAGRVTKEYQTADARPDVSLSESRYYYDVTGRRLATTSVVTDSAGAKRQSGKSVDYNAFGDISKEYQAWGSASIASLSGLTRAIRYSFTHDTMGRISSSQGQNGTNFYYYDLLGHVTREEQRGNQNSADGTSTRVVEIVYDLLGRATQQRLPAFTGIAENWGATTSMLNPKVMQEYDRWGNVIARTDVIAADTVDPAYTRYDYNHNNQVIRETLPIIRVTKENGSEYSPEMVHEIHYNNLGLAEREVDKANGAELRSRSKTYNEVGQLASTTDATGVKTDHRYDALGNQVVTKNGLGIVYVNTYDALGNQIERAVLRLPNGNTYTGTGTPVKVVLNTYDYDAAGRRTAEWSYAVTQANGMTLLQTGAAKRYRYNESGLLTWFSNENGIITTYQYDIHGNKTQERNALGHIRKWAYSYNTSDHTFGRLLSSHDISDVQTTYSYSDFGQVTLESSSHWQKTYNYHQNGLLQRVVQSAGSASKRADYDYDIRGNRVREVHSGSGNSYTQLMVYDLRNRLSMVRLEDAGQAGGNDMGYAFIGYSYDEFGNRLRINGSYRDPDQPHTPEGYPWRNGYDVRYSYDREGRVLIEEGTLVNGVLSIANNKGVRLTYDAAGQRMTEERLKWASTDDDIDYYAVVTTTYIYNDLGLVKTRLDEESRTGTDSSYSHYSSSTTSYRYNLRGFKLEERKGNDVTETAYHADGRVAYQHTFDDDELQNSVHYDRYDSYGNRYDGYDAAGNLIHYRYNHYDSDFANEYENLYTYEYVINKGEYKNKGVEVDTDVADFTTGETSMEFDAFGNVKHINIENGKDGEGNQIKDTDKDLYYNVDGQVIYTKENRLYGPIEYSKNTYVYVNGNTFGVIRSNGRTDFAPFDIDKGDQQAATPSQYIVIGGETLEGISRAVYGNARYWYLIADANGLNYGATDEIASEDAGRALRIPNVISNKYNDSDTFKLYNPAEIIGDLTPTPVAPPPPSLESKSSGLASIIMIVVAVVVTIYTAGAAAGAMGVTATATGATTTAAIGSAALAGGLGTTGIIAAGIGGFVGSLASQFVGKALGVVDDISLSSAFASGLTAGIGAGVGGALQASNISWLKNAEGGLSTAGKAIQAASSYAGSYVSNRIAGLDVHFDWKDLAIQALSSVASGYLNDNVLNESLIGNDVIRGTVQGIAGAAIHGNMSRAWSDGRKLNWGQVAADAFGNALANTFAEHLASRPPKPAKSAIGPVAHESTHTSASPEAPAAETPATGEEGVEYITLDDGTVMRRISVDHVDPSLTASLDANDPWNPVANPNGVMSTDTGANPGARPAGDLNLTLEEYLAAVKNGLWKGAPVMEGVSGGNDEVKNTNKLINAAQASGTQDVETDPRYIEFLKETAFATTRAIAPRGEKTLILAINSDGAVVVKRIAIFPGQGGSIESLMDGAGAVAHVHYEGLVQQPSGPDKTPVKFWGVPSFVIGRTGSKIWEIGRINNEYKYRTVNLSKPGNWQQLK